MLGGLALAACSTSSVLQTVGVDQGYLGAVVGDEPRAVLVARDVLASGGNAADAAVAMYFALAVTYPAAAGLGAGGACIVYDLGQDRTEALDFPARAAAPDAVTGLPGAVRGFFSLNTRYGNSEWGQLLGPAEQLARFGHPVSRALARVLAAEAPRLLADPGAAAIFGKGDGTVLSEGDKLTQLDLAAVITRLRTRGPGQFYNGSLARDMIDAAAAAGVPIDVEALRSYQPKWSETAWVREGFARVHAVPNASGVAMLQVWRMIVDRLDTGDPALRDHLIAEASMRAWADWIERRDQGRAVDPATLVSADYVDGLMAGYAPDSHRPPARLAAGAKGPGTGGGATSFAILDGDGSAVACTVSLNRPFGVARVLPGSGIIPAAAPSGDGGVESPAMIIDHNSLSPIFIGAAVGGGAAPVSLATVMARAVIGKTTLDAALAAPRLYDPAAPDVVAVESSPDRASVAKRRAALEARGHATREAPALGLVNGILCLKGFTGAAGDCIQASDGRGGGLADVAQF